MFKKYTSEFSKNLSLSIPIMMGSLGHLLVGFADDIMVGHLSPVQLAATSLGNSLFFIALSIGIGFSFAIAPLIAETDGKDDKEKGRLLFQHSLLICTILGILMYIGLYFLKPLLYALDQPEEVVALAIPYYEMISISIIPLMIFQGIKQFTDGLSQTKYGMRASLVNNIVNVLLNFFLIYGLWVFPRMEIEGAALGTLISRFAMVLFMIAVLYRKKKFKPYISWMKLSEIKSKIIKKIMGLGFPTALQMLFEVGLFSTTIILVGTFGALPQAANQIALKLSSTTYMIAVGIGVANSIRVGNQKGLKNFHELRRIAISNFLLVSLLMIGFSVIYLLFSQQLPWIFTSDKEVISIASTLLIIAAFYQVSDGLQTVILGALRGLQDVIIPSCLTFIAYGFIGFPVCYILGVELEMKASGVWIGLLIALCASSIFLYIRFHLLSKKLIKKNS